MSNYTQSDYERDLAIRDNAPDGATHVDILVKVTYWKFSGRKGGEWLFEGEWRNGNVGYLPGIKSLEQLKTAIAQYETIEKLKGALNDEMSGYYCPDADKAKEDYCFRHKVCSECKGKHYLADLLKELTE